jgi:hypothetical protein
MFVIAIHNHINNPLYKGCIECVYNYPADDWVESTDIFVCFRQPGQDIFRNHYRLRFPTYTAEQLVE